MAKECKYYKQKKQVSYDGGVTWQDVVPAEYQKGALYEQQSTDCGYVPPVTQYRWVKTNDTTCVEEGPEVQYRWVNMDASVDYYCEGTTKYYKQKKQVSYDGGQTWQDVSPAEYQKGGAAETQSTDCGYVPPTPTGKKFVGTYSDGKTLEVECNGDGTLTNGETQPYGYDSSKMTSAIIGQCVTSIGESAFDWCISLTSVTIPNSVTNIGSSAFAECNSLTSIKIPNSITSIGEDTFWGCSGLTNIVIPDSVTTIGDSAFIYCYGLTSITIGNSVTRIGGQAFYRCSGLTSVTIPDSVTSIGTGAFRQCSGLTSIICLATTPPSLGGPAAGSFGDTNNCPIYVPAQSVNTYKFQWEWYGYQDRIQPIP